MKGSRYCTLLILSIQCPLFGVAKPDKDDTISGADQPTTSLEDGLMFNQRVLDRRVNNLASNQQMVLSDEEYEDGSDLDDLLGEFSKDERKIILREVAKMSTDSEIDEESPQKKKRNVLKKVGVNAKETDLYRTLIPKKKAPKRRKRNANEIDHLHISTRKKRKQRQNVLRKIAVNT